MKIHPDAFRVAADIVEQLEQIGFSVTLGHIEGQDPEHYLLNLDAVQADHEPAEHPDALQRVLNDIGSDHADELAVAAPEAPMYPEEHGPAYWDLEAMIRIREGTDR